MLASPIARSVRVRRAAALAVAVAASLALAGCTGDAPASTTPSAAATKSSALSPLLPSYPKNLTAAQAKAETVRTADAVQALIAKTDIVNVDDKSRAVAKTKTAGAYYGVLRAITTSKGFDVQTQGTAMDKLLVAAGWTQRQDSDTAGVYAALLSSDSAGGTSLILLKADATVKASPVITIQLVSPDLPS
jgi:hypothetical protein